MRPAWLAVVAIALIAIMAGATESSVAAGFPARDSRYHDYRETEATIMRIASEHPGIVRVFSIGESHQGRPIWTVEISDRVGHDEGEPEVMFDALHHAREHLTTEMALYTLRLLTGQYGRDTELGRRITRLVDTRRIWIVPIVNPDGLRYDLSGGQYGGGAYRGWRKNRQPTPGSGATGTDLNRNYGYRWRPSDEPVADTYPGPRMWSAPETRAVRDFVLSRRDGAGQRIRTYATFHTAGEQILWPYGYTHADVPRSMDPLDHRVFVAMGKRMASLNGYRPMQSSDIGRKRGSLIDWLHGSQGIFGFTFELYPRRGRSMARFYPPDEVIDRETRRNRAAVLYLIELADCPYRATGNAADRC